MHQTALQRAIVTVGAIFLALIVAWNWLRYGDALGYRWFELPVVRSAVTQQPGIAIRGLRSNTAPGEPEELRVIFGIAGKGDIALWRPTRASFTGGGPIIIDGIGSCGITPTLSLTIDPVFSDLHIEAIGDIAVHYNTIEARVRANGWCLSGNNLEVQEPCGVGNVVGPPGWDLIIFDVIRRVDLIRIHRGDSAAIASFIAMMCLVNYLLSDERLGSK